MTSVHGVVNKETDSQTQTTTTVNMSVIGLVGTAPDAAAGTAASLTLGSTLADNAIVYTAAAVGTDGNSLQVTIVTGAASAVTAAVYADSLLTITLGADDTGAATATAAEVVAAVTALASSDITAALYSGTTGAGLVVACAATNLSGGVDEPFPLYTPALISGSRNKAKKLGYTGTLYADMYDILNNASALVVVVRVEEDADADQQRANILQGIEALQVGQNTLNYQPRILVAPEWSTDDGVAKSLESMASTLSGIAYIDSPAGATAESVAVRGQQYGSRVEIMRPRPYVTSDVTGKSVNRPYSAVAAGLRVAVDNEYGYWWSKSNKEVLGVTGFEQMDSFVIGDANCVANQLNQANVSTVILLDSYKHWGNRLCGGSAPLYFEAVRRTMDAIEASIQLMVTKNFTDRPIDKAFGTSITGSINAYLRKLTTQGVINGGTCWLDDYLNTEEELQAGNVYLNVTVGPKSPAEQITITYSIDESYTVTELSSSSTTTS